ncbi:MAG: helix-turn-helix transcriptional regulator [Desulfosporosinus sp.]|nr:helix-turn-helix transcriptional regulator [Desulfosporosinus sp.]
MTVGKRIKKFRKEKGLTQVRLAEMAGISRSYLADVEANRYNPSLGTLMDVALALNIPSSCLLDDKEIDFSNLIRSCKQKGLSLNSLGELLGIPQDSLDLIRSNKIPDEDTMSKIVDHFDCTWDYLIGKTNSPDDLVFGDKPISIPSLTPNIKTESRNVPATIAAHFENADFTEEETKEISNFINFIASKRKK